MCAIGSKCVYTLWNTSSTVENSRSVCDVAAALSSELLMLEAMQLRT